MGAGPGGLATGYWLAKHGVECHGTSSVPRWSAGWRAPSRSDGFKFDLGGHRWFSKVDEVNDFYKEVIADETVWVHRVSRIYFDGKYIDYPLKVGNALAAIGPVAGGEGAGSTMRADPPLSSASIQSRSVSMEDAYVDQYGRTLYEFFFERYSEKVWGRPCGADERRLGQPADEGDVARHGGERCDHPVEGGKVQSLIDSFMYPRYGYGRLSERMAEGIAASRQRGAPQSAASAKVLREGNHVTAVVTTDADRQRGRRSRARSSSPRSR